jgi:O-antigen/teichoic acid export membrane protein
MEDSIRMKKHVTIVGAIHIVFGIIGLIIALAAFFLMDFAKGFIPAEDVPDAVMKLISVILATFPLLLGVISTLRVVGGIGLLSHQTWARYIIIVVAVIGMLKIPIGTLVGVYSLWVLLQAETVKLFEKQ